jgi:hypothetical protein
MELWVKASDARELNLSASRLRALDSTRSTYAAPVGFESETVGRDEPLDPQPFAALDGDVERLVARVFQTSQATGSRTHQKPAGLPPRDLRACSLWKTPVIGPRRRSPTRDCACWREPVCNRVSVSRPRPHSSST